MKLMTRPFTFMVAVLYGVAWVTGLLNVVAAVLAATEGRNPCDYASTLILASGLILFIHSRMGWFPFRR